jgi:hypothetical protein
MHRTSRYCLTGLALAAALLAGCAGFPKDLTVTERKSAPPPGKVLVNFHRPSNWGGGQRFPIFNGAGTFIVDMPGGTEFQYVCDPGEQIFIAWAEQSSVVKGDLAADKVYDIMVDISMGWVSGNIKLAPLAKGDPRRAELAKFETREKVVTQTRTDHIEKYEAERKAKLEEIKRDFLGGEKSDRLGVIQKEDCR